MTAPDGFTFDEALAAVKANPLEVEGGKFGLRPPESTPLPNGADEAWERLERLREEARALGIDVKDEWPIARLKEEIAAAS